MIAWFGMIVSLAGVYVIYKNKEMNGFKHLQSTHAIAGLFIMLNCIGIGMAGGIVLHPDFGIDKTNKTIRFVHTSAARITLLAAWLNAFVGLYSMNVPTNMLLMYGIPLILLVPFSLL
jgi:Eukaryotic cytochrome b561